MSDKKIITNDDISDNETGRLILRNMPVMPIPLTVICFAVIILIFAGIIIDSSFFHDFALTGFIPLIFSAAAACIFASILMFRPLFRNSIWPAAAVESAVFIIFLIFQPLMIFIPLIFIFSERIIIFSAVRRFSCSKTIVILTVSYFIAAGISIAAALAFSGTSFSEVSRETIQNAYSALLSIQLPNPDGSHIQLFSENAAGQYIRFMLYMLPSFAVLFFMFTAAVCAKIFHFLMSSLNMKIIFHDPDWLIKSGKPAAVIFTAAYIISFLAATSYGMDIVYYSVQNIVMIFMPALFITGFRNVLNRICGPGFSFKKCVWSAVFIFIFFSASGITSAVFSFIGTVSVLREKSLPGSGS